MSNTSCLGRKVKWVGKDGGWKTGRVLTFSTGAEAALLKGYASQTIKWILVKEDNCGTITEVELSSLQPWPDVEYCSRCTKEKGKCKCFNTLYKEEDLKPLLNQPPIVLSRKDIEQALQDYRIYYRNGWSKLACTVPQERVTLEEVLNSGDEFCYLVM